MFDLTVLLGLIAPSIASALAGVYLWVARKKLHLEVTMQQEALIRHVVTGAVSFAEETAQKALAHSATMSSTDKLGTARLFATDELARLKLPAMTPPQIDAAIHAALGAALGNGR